MRSGELPELPSVTVTRCQRLELVWTGFPLHLDAVSKVDIEEPEEMRQAKGVTPELADERKDVVAVEVMPGALKLRLPAPAEAEAQQ
jgi:hypothetical protein